MYSDGSRWFAQKKNGRLRVSFRAPTPCEIRHAWVRTAPNGEAVHHPMKKHRHGLFELWSASIPIVAGRASYRFEIHTKSGLRYLNQRGVCDLPPFDCFDFVYIDEALPVPWLCGRTFYQIFPDRFAVGRAGKKPGNYKYQGGRPRLRRWGARPYSYRKGRHIDFFGGDLPGIERKIPYLKQLGISAVYLNPIFQAPSNHRYDVQDYDRIDPMLGTNRDYKRLVDALHREDIRIIIDGVFNHVGCAHRWFNRELFYEEEGAWQSPDSPFAEFFTFSRHPDGYHCWLGVQSLPVLNYRSDRLRRLMYENDDSVMKKWIKSPYNTDGWRFDVANMLARDGNGQLYKSIWPQIRRHLKTTKPDVYLLGEHFFDATDLLDGSCLDAVMNYRGFYFPMLRWLTGYEHLTPGHLKSRQRLSYGARELACELLDVISRIPFQVACGQFNLIGSHDTSRILSLLNGNKDLVRIAATLMMTWPGVPCVYYGDEIGMKGEGDPGCRACMVWNDNERDLSLFDWFSALARLKRKSRPLALGGVLVMYAEDNALVFARVAGDSFAIVLLNRSTERAVDIDLDVRSLGIPDCTLASPLTGETVDVVSGRCQIIIRPLISDVFTSD